MIDPEAPAVLLSDLERRQQAQADRATQQSLRDRQTEVLLQSHHTLAEQIAELTMTQQRIERAVPAMIESGMAKALNDSVLSDDERRWVRMAIHSEARRATFRDAVIEKTLAGLVWVMLGGLGFAVWEFIKTKLGTR